MPCIALHWQFSNGILRFQKGCTPQAGSGVQHFPCVLVPVAIILADDSTAKGQARTGELF